MRLVGSSPSTVYGELQILHVGRVQWEPFWLAGIQELTSSEWIPALQQFPSLTEVQLLDCMHELMAPFVQHPDLLSGTLRLLWIDYDQTYEDFDNSPLPFTLMPLLVQALETNPLLSMENEWTTVEKHDRRLELGVQTTLDTSQQRSTQSSTLIPVTMKCFSPCALLAFALAAGSLRALRLEPLFEYRTTPF